MPHHHLGRHYLKTRSLLPLGSYGWLYRNLSSWKPPSGEKSLRALAAAMTSALPPHREHPSLPAAYTYFGQMIAHDLTFDPATAHQRLDDPGSIHNFRTPAFDLDCLYGRGPADQPYLYRRLQPYRLLSGRGLDGVELDVPRNAQGLAIVGDPRQDENVILSQLHTVFIEFHDRVLEEVCGAKPPDLAKFERAQQLVRWHYQWVVLHDYLRRILEPEVYSRLSAALDPSCSWRLSDLRHFRPRHSAFIPIEFASAAFRFGHATARDGYVLNEVLGHNREHPQIPLFGSDEEESLKGRRSLPEGWGVEWPLFLDMGSTGYQHAMRIEARLSPVFAAVPVGVDQRENLAYLDLRRGVDHCLPSGQALARAMALEDVLTAEEMGLPAKEETPLWLYILKEAELRQDGLCLGRLGSELVGEVIVGLARLDPFSYLSINPRWRPKFTDSGRFTLAELIGFALSA